MADKESFSAALLTQQNQPPEKLSESRQHSEQSQELLDEGSSAAKRKRQRHESGNSQIKSGSQEQISSNSKKIPFVWFSICDGERIGKQPVTTLMHMFMRAYTHTHIQ